MVSLMMHQYYHAGCAPSGTESSIRRTSIFRDSGRVNGAGGAIALGHPIGATGGMLIGTAVEQLHRLDKETSLVAMCTGGGMGTATILERM